MESSRLIRIGATVLSMFIQL